MKIPPVKSIGGEGVCLEAESYVYPADSQLLACLPKCLVADLKKEELKRRLFLSPAKRSTYIVSKGDDFRRKESITTEVIGGYEA